MNSSPLRSTTSSCNCSVVFDLISFNSASLFDIITTVAAEALPDDEIDAGTRAETCCWILTPWKEEEVEVAETDPLRKIAAVPGVAIERLSIVAMAEEEKSSLSNFEDNEESETLGIRLFLYLSVCPCILPLITK